MISVSSSILLGSTDFTLGQNWENEEAGTLREPTHNKKWRVWGR